MEPIRHPFEDPPSEGACTEVADGVLWLRLPLPMALDHVNVYALRDDCGWTVIDTGIHSRRSVGIWQAVLDGPLRREPVSRVIVTHHHPDHVGMAGWFQDVVGAELFTTRTAWLYARMLSLDVQDCWPKETLDFYRSAGMESGVFERRSESRPYNFADVVHPMPLGFLRIRDGDVLEIGHRRWRVVTGNGHAPEHAMLWAEDDGLVIAGDQVLPGISSNLGVYPTEPDADPVGEWLESCERIAGMAREDCLVLPGHKLPFTGLPARVHQLIEHHRLALARLLEHLAVPSTAHGCFPALFGRDVREDEYVLAMAESVAHLNHLHRSGRIRRQRRAEGDAWLWSRANGRADARSGADDRDEAPLRTKDAETAAA